MHYANSGIAFSMEDLLDRSQSSSHTCHRAEIIVQSHWFRNYTQQFSFTDD